MLVKHMNLGGGKILGTVSQVRMNVTEGVAVTVKYRRIFLAQQNIFWPDLIVTSCAVQGGFCKGSTRVRS